MVISTGGAKAVLRSGRGHSLVSCGDVEVNPGPEEQLPPLWPSSPLRPSFATRKGLMCPLNRTGRGLAPMTCGDIEPQLGPPPTFSNTQCPLTVCGYGPLASPTDLVAHLNSATARCHMQCWSRPLRRMGSLVLRLVPPCCVYQQHVPWTSMQHLI